jgi:hypothetical protein
MINFSLNEMRVMKILLRGDDYDPTESDLDYINTLGEKRVLKLLVSVETKLDKILKIRQSNGIQEKKPKAGTTTTHS